MAPAGRIVVLGDITVDIVATCSEVPSAGQCVRPSRLVVSGGGSAANTALALARLGFPVALLGRVGSDAMAGEALAVLGAAGVDLAHVQRDMSEATGLVYGIVTGDNRRTTIAYQGASAAYTLDERALAVVGGARLLHVSGYALLATSSRAAAKSAIGVAGDCGVEVSLDPCVSGPEEVVAELRGLAPGLAVLAPNRSETLRLAGLTSLDAAVSELSARCPGLVAVKDGAAGCVLAHAGKVTRMPGLTVAGIDPTGAGDAFDAALIAGWLDGLELDALAVVANTAGALVASRSGAQTSGFGAELIALLEAGGGRLPDSAVTTAMQWLGRLTQREPPQVGTA
jgi:sugar/nucleoside kinase (ribokinase family)